MTCGVAAGGRVVLDPTIAEEKVRVLSRSCPIIPPYVWDLGFGIQDRIQPCPSHPQYHVLLKIFLEASKVDLRGDKLI